MGFGGYLRANTAVDVLIGPFLDDSDGNTAETGLTITQADIRLSKNGQNMAQKNDANACTHDEIGYYNCPLDATDTNTEGLLTLCVHESGALAARMDFQVLAEAAWDSLNVAKDDGFMDVNIKTVGRSDTQETEANNLESACSNYSATRGLTGTALPAAAADAAGGVPISDAGGLDIDTLLGRITANVATEAKQDVIDGIVDNIVADTNELQTDDYPTSIAAVQTTVDAIETAVITNAAGVDVAADIIAVKAETANILTDTGTTLPGTLSTIDGKIDTVDGIVDSILTDTGTTLDAIVDAILVDTGTTLPATLSSIDGKIDTIDTVVDAIKVITDALTAAAATKIALSAGSMVTGTVSHDNTAASTTVFYSDDVTEATADHYNGRLVTFTSGDLQGQYTDITDYALDSGEGKFTVTALTEAPADNVTFIII